MLPENEAIWSNRASLFYREKKQKIQDIKNNIKEAIEVSVEASGVELN